MHRLCLVVVYRLLIEGASSAGAAGARMHGLQKLWHVGSVAVAPELRTQTQ